MLGNGATTVLVRDFVLELVLDILEHQRVTNAVLVPTMLKLLADVPGAAERDYSSLRSIAYGASPITTPVLKAALRTFRAPLYGIYGLTESTGGITQLEPADHDPDGPREHLLRSAGRPFPWVELGSPTRRRAPGSARARSARCGCARRTSWPATTSGPPRRPRR